MGHLPADAHRFFATQHGVASIEQLLATGISTSQLRRLETAGALVRVLNSAYRTPSVRFDELGRCAAVCLARPLVAIAGPTAGRLWGFRRLPPDHRVHILAPPASHPVHDGWVVPYRTAAFHDDDVVHRADGIRVTSRARTALDLSRWLTASDLLSVIEQAMHDGDLSESALWNVAADWISPQRPWITHFFRQIHRRLPGGPAESHPEVRVAVALERAGVLGLHRQYALELPGYGGARFDLALPHMRWAIEIDVHPRHAETAGLDSDTRRDVAATSVGWTVSRVSRRDYLRDFTPTVARLVAFYRERHRQRIA